MGGTTEVPLSARAVILEGMNPEALAVGYSDADQRWITAAARECDFEALPRLDGVLVVGEPGLVAAADDFGHIIHRRPSAVLSGARPVWGSVTGTSGGEHDGAVHCSAFSPHEGVGDATWEGRRSKVA